MKYPTRDAHLEPTLCNLPADSPKGDTQLLSIVCLACPAAPATAGRTERNGTVFNLRKVALRA